MTRLAGCALLAALTLGGCATDDAPSPVMGTWVIATVNGQPLPVEMGEIVFGETRATAELISGVVDIGTQQYAYTSRFNGYVEGQPLAGNPYTFFQSGTHTYSNGVVTFTPGNPNQPVWQATHLQQPERLRVLEDENEAVLVRQ
jgi:hypothetical protein